MKINNTKNFDLTKYIQDVIDFPKKGIVFKDITPILENPEAFNFVVDTFTEVVNKTQPDVILGIESRGFLFGAPLALKTNKPFILARKPNKLPREVIKKSYKLEYGESVIEIHKGSIKPNQRVLVIDDLVATGGTVSATEELIKSQNANCVGCCFVINLTFLKPEEKIKSDIYSIIEY